MSLNGATEELCCPFEFMIASPSKGLAAMCLMYTNTQLSNTITLTAEINVEWRVPAYICTPVLCEESYSTRILLSLLSIDLFS
jgi:hypothetical protein